MYVIINRANLVVCKTSGVKYVRQQPNGVTVLARDGDATAIYADDTDAFYPISASGEWDCEQYRAIEVDTVPERSCRILVLLRRVFHHAGKRGGTRRRKRTRNYK
jgi:hypothetical protein